LLILHIHFICFCDFTGWTNIDDSYANNFFSLPLLYIPTLLIQAGPLLKLMLVTYENGELNEFWVKNILVQLGDIYDSREICKFYAYSDTVHFNDCVLGFNVEMLQPKVVYFVDLENACFFVILRNIKIPSNCTQNIKLEELKCRALLSTKTSHPSLQSVEKRKLEN
jgi:hypothetical protein